MIAQDSWRDGSKPMLASIFFRIPTRRSEVDPQVPLEIGHVRLDDIERKGMCKATTTPHLSIKGAQNHELLDVDRTTQRCTEQLFDLGLMCDEHFATHAEPTGLAKKDQADLFDVNDQRKLPKSCSRFAFGTPSESSIPMRVEDERISRP
jgi:hypothetical protein